MRNFSYWVTQTSRVFAGFAIALMAAAALVVTQMVVWRYFLNASTVWQTEFVIYALVAATFVGSPYVLLHNGHVKVDLLQNYVSPGVKRWLNALALGLSLVFCVLLTHSGWDYFHEAWAGNWTTDTVWALPLWIPLLPLPLGMGLLCLQLLVQLLALFSEEANP